MVNNQTHFRKLEQMYLDAPVNRLYQPEIAISKGEAEITIQVKEDYLHAAHAMHGAVYFKMLDDAAFFAANSVVTDTFVLTTSFTIHFFRPVFGGEIQSKGKLLFKSKNLFVSEATLFDEKGVEVAYGSGSFMKSHQPLSSEIGYRLK